MEEKQPILSIVICTYNREAFIAKTLLHLSQQAIAKDAYEVIIVNNKSTDQTENICLDFIRQHPEMQIHYCIEKNSGLSYARNRGIKEASGKLVTFIDDDAFVRQDFGCNIIRFFENHTKVQAIGGKVVPAYLDGSPTWMSPYLLPLVSALDMGEQTKRFQGKKFPVGANMTFRKSVFDRYGLFDIRLGRIGSGLLGGEEKEMISRLKKHADPIFYVPDVVVEHIIPPRRLQMDYIQGLAEGVGKSEKRRLKSKPLIAKLSRAIEELIKIGGTVILFVLFTLKGQWAKGWMLLKFRYWVLLGFLK